MTAIRVEPLRAGAFSPFGTIVAHGDAAGRHYLPFELGCAPGGLVPRNWTMRLPGHPGDSLVATRLERHPWSSQGFVPLGGEGLLAIVALKAPDGEPDVDSLRAFCVPHGSGVVYGVDVWHHGMVALGGGSDVFVTMGLCDRPEDTIHADLPVAVTIAGLNGY